MNFLLNVLKGIMIGIANVIPGVSGGTMAVSLGIYDRLLGSISGLFKHLRESITFLFQIFLGCAIGIIGFTYAIEYLLSNHTFVTCMAFVGLILGGLPMLWKSMRNELKKSRSTIGVSGVLFFLLGLLVCGGFPLLKAGDEAMTVIAVTPLNMLILFVLGVVASATMVIPGVSGSMMLMIFGYYYGIIGTIKGFLDGVRALDFAVMRDGFLLLFPFGIGVLLGIFLIAKLITFLFEQYGVQTYCAIMGLVIASPFAIFYNTGLFPMLSSLSVWTVLFGVLLMAAGAVITNLVGEAGN